MIVDVYSRPGNRLVATRVELLDEAGRDSFTTSSFVHGASRSTWPRSSYAFYRSRSESDPCIAGTPGCSSSHSQLDSSCETW